MNCLVEKQRKIINAFFLLLRSGLWEKPCGWKTDDSIALNDILKIAEEQSVVGLISAGLEHVEGAPLPKEEVLAFVGSALQLEQRNKAMNSFLEVLLGKMRKEDIYTLFLKGQGIAQCYKRPLWRACGDIDFFLSNDNYEKAKHYFIPLASSAEKEYKRDKHLEMTIDGWVVELHGCLRCSLSSRVNRGLDEIMKETFYGGNVRSWMNGSTQVFLLGAENDAIYVFSHILEHFYNGGIGLRQICDLCRLLWTYRDKLNKNSLESRIRQMGLISEWKAFGALAVEWLGMPKEAMPMYDESPRWRKKANRIIDFILMSGNMGHNRDASYMKKPYLARKCHSAGRRIVDLISHARIFPLDSLLFLFYIMKNGMQSALRGEG